MIDIEYLRKGIYGLARAYRASGMAGHLGAAVTAGCFFCEENPDLSKDVYVGIARELDAIINGEEAVWFDPIKAGITIEELFDTFPDSDPRSDNIGTIADALKVNIDATRDSGQNVIFD